MSSKNPNTDTESQKNVKDDPHPEISWWLKYLVKGIGTTAGALAMGTGVWTCITIKATCLIAGILLCVFGFTVIVFEAPCCCNFLDFVEKIGQFGDRRPYWQKASIYMCFGVIPAVMCFGFSVIPGAGGIFATGVLYGMMALGRKADRETMQQRASAGNSDMKMGLINNDVNQKAYSGGK